MYQKGQDVLKDYVIAQRRYNLGAGNVNEMGAKQSKYLVKLMTSEGVLKAQAMASACMSNNYEKCGY